MASKCIFICLAIFFLATLTDAVPLTINNATDIVNGTAGQPVLNFLPTLRQRSPMDPAGPSSRQGPSGAAVAGPSTSSSTATGFTSEKLRAYAREGRDYYMEIILADVKQTGTLLNDHYKLTGPTDRWQQIKVPEAFWRMVGPRET